MIRRQGGTGETGGGPAGERAQDAGRDRGAAEIEDGAAVDAIAASIRPTGFLRAGAREGESPESADDLFTAHFHGLVDLQREVGAQAAEWAEGQEPGAENHSARLAVEGVRALLVRQMAVLAAREAPPSPDEIACLALALHRIEVVDKHRLEGERAAGESAATQAPRKHPSTQEMRALLGPAIKKGFHPERLGSKPWEPWPDAPAPAEPDAAPPEPSPDPSGDPSPWGEPEAQDGADARDAPLSEDAHEEHDPEDAREALGKGAAWEEHDLGHARGAQDEVRVRGAQDADDVPQYRAPQSLVLGRRIVATGDPPRPLAMVRVGSGPAVRPSLPCSFSSVGGRSLRSLACAPFVVMSASLTPRNPARSMDYRADRRPTRAPNNNR